MTPQGIEAQYTRAENWLLNAIGRRRFPGLEMVVLALYGAVFFLWFQPLWQKGYVSWGRAFLVQDRALLMPLLLGLTLVSLYLRPQFQTVVLFLSTCVIWVYGCYEWIGFSFSMLVWPVLLGTAYLGGQFSLGRGRARQLIAAIFFIALFFVMAFLLGWEAQKLGKISILRFFWLIHPELFLAFVLTAYFGYRNRAALPQFLNPVNVVAPTIWPESSLRSLESFVKVRLWWQGFFNILLAQFLFFVYFQILDLSVRYGVPPGVPLSLIQYASFLIVIIAAMNTTAGAARMFGYKVPDATFFLVLAKSPLEVWQRASTYLYQFILNFIFLPLYRKTRSYAVTGLFCFIAIVTHMFLFHDLVVRGFYKLVLPVFPAPQVDVAKVFLTAFSYAGIWLVFILIGTFFWGRRVRLFPWWGQWVCIGLTHLGASSIFGLTHLVVAPYLLEVLGLK